MTIRPVLLNPNDVSEEFKQACEAARIAALGADDDAVRYMAEVIPIYAQARPTREQAMAGGCATCTYLGLWADRWPGYPNSAHGHIWLFDQGIRAIGGNLHRQVYSTLLHEFDHALQRDHVLDAMEGRKNGANAQRAAAMAFLPQPRPCCGS